LGVREAATDGIDHQRRRQQEEDWQQQLKNIKETLNKSRRQREARRAPL
jgi:hypothetical protein